MNERLRLKTLCSRNGIKTTREWAKATAVAYRLYISDSNIMPLSLIGTPLREESS